MLSVLNGQLPPPGELPAGGAQKRRVGNAAPASSWETPSMTQTGWEARTGGAPRLSISAPEKRGLRRIRVWRHQLRRNSTASSPFRGVLPAGPMSGRSSQVLFGGTDSMVEAAAYRAVQAVQGQAFIRSTEPFRVRNRWKAPIRSDPPRCRALQSRSVADRGREGVAEAPSPRSPSEVRPALPSTMKAPLHDARPLGSALSASETENASFMTGLNQEQGRSMEAPGVQSGHAADS